MPSQYLNLPKLEKAFIIASIQVKIDAEKKSEQKAKQNAKRSGKGSRGRKR
ncbi:hypothetical protein [Paucisalibacillus globulus]|uniref:hypothetical protein n=1 Tax=Paucisalibacillus globulus TaxID=351095 RepID=UPI001596E7FC|nr:hypothetical protein [Paucisalibacillus globulus]